jgi:hypothetical protein
MKLALRVAGAALSIAIASPANAGSGDVAAGLLGGFAAGAFVGSVLAGPRPVYVAPAPVYVGPPPPPVQCYWTKGQAYWDGVRWVRPRVQVCD